MENKRDNFNLVITSSNLNIEKKSVEINLKVSNIILKSNIDDYELDLDFNQILSLDKISEYKFCLITLNKSCFIVIKYEFTNENKSLIELWTNTLSDDLKIYQPLDNNNIEKKALILINPKAGKGRSERIFKRYLKSILIHSGITFDVLVTEYSGHAKKFIQEYSDQNSAKWPYGIIIMSGDGLVYEIINGIYESPNGFEKLNKLRLGIIPVGSGNALAKSMRYKNENKNDDIIISNIRIVGRGYTQKCDLFQIQFQDMQCKIENNTINMMGFLNIGWGIIPEIDIESEKLRKLGSSRFTVYGLLEIIKSRTYKGKVSYRPVRSLEASTRVNPDKIPLEHDLTTIFNDKLIDINEPLGPGWVTLEDDFIGVTLTNLPWLSQNDLLAPESEMNDGLLYLMILRDEAMNRKKLLKMLLSLEKGDHINISGVEMIPVKGIRMEVQDGKIRIDGELVQTNFIQAQILPQVINVMCQ